jgi:hypothetical protein
MTKTRQEEREGTKEPGLLRADACDNTMGVIAKLCTGPPSQAGFASGLSSQLDPSSWDRDIRAGDGDWEASGAPILGAGSREWVVGRG